MPEHSFMGETLSGHEQISSGYTILMEHNYFSLNRRKAAHNSPFLPHMT
ncbi:hypothetical protein H3S80_08390 [Bartonella sp. M0177]|nr:hypothetical protein [Bartonella sp. M0177]MBI0004064.1 hypothetical protein [Bartonella sp. M0177]